MEDSNEKNEFKNQSTLFNIINYKKQDDLDRFINEMNPDHALFVLVQAGKYSYSKGLYSLEEGEVLSKAIRILTTPPKNKSEDTPPDPEIHTS